MLNRGMIVLGRAFGIMPWWCWLMYVGIAPAALWVILSQRALMWDAASDWRHLRWVAVAIGVTLTVALVVWSAVTTTREHGERVAGRHGKRASAFVVGLLACGTIAGGIAINLASARVDGYLREMQPSVKDFYVNHDTTRLAGRTIKMIILKARPKDAPLEVRYSVTRIANHAPEAWVRLATTNETMGLLVDQKSGASVDDKALARFLLLPETKALSSERWLEVIDLWVADVGCEPLPEETRSGLADRLHETFAEAIRESAKYAWEKGDRAWPALQIDMGRMLLEEARRGVRPDDKELNAEMGVLHKDSQCLHDLAGLLDGKAASRHVDLLNRTQSILDELRRIQDSLGEMDKKLDLILLAITPRPSEDAIQKPTLSPGQEGSLREVLAMGNPLQHAIAAVALGSVSTGSDRWSAADAALREADEWKETGVAWMPRDESRLLMARGDRLLYDGDVEGAQRLYELAAAAQPGNLYAETRVQTTTVVMERRRRPVIIEEPRVIVRQEPVYVPAPSVPWHQGLSWDPIVAVDTSSKLLLQANTLRAATSCRGCAGQGEIKVRERAGTNDRGPLDLIKEARMRTVTKRCEACGGNRFDDHETTGRALSVFSRVAGRVRARTEKDEAQFRVIGERVKEAVVREGRELPTLNDDAKALFGTMDINRPTPTWFTGTVTDRVELGRENGRAVAMRVRSRAGCDVVVVDPIADAPSAGDVYVFGVCTKVHDGPAGQMPVVQNALVVVK